MYESMDIKGERSNNNKTALSKKKGGCWSIFNCCSCGTNQDAEEEININNIKEGIEEKINESNIKNDDNIQSPNNSLVIKEDIKSSVSAEKNQQFSKENNINYSQNNYIDVSLCEKENKCIEENIEENKVEKQPSLVNISEEEENKNKDIFTNIVNGKKKETCIIGKEDKSNLMAGSINLYTTVKKDDTNKNNNTTNNFDFTHIPSINLQGFDEFDVKGYITKNNININEFKLDDKSNFKLLKMDNTFLNNNISNNIINNNISNNIINNNPNNNTINEKNKIKESFISIKYKNTKLVDGEQYKGTMMGNKDIKNNIIEGGKKLVPEREKEDMDKSNIRLNGKYSDIKKGEIDENLVNKDKNINNNFKGNKGSGDEFFIKGDGMNYSMYVGTIRLNKPDNKSFCSGKDKKIEFTLQFKREQKGKEDCLKEYKMILERVGEGELKVTMHDVKNKTDIEVKILNNETVKENIKKDFEKIVDKIARSENKKNIIDLILSTVKNNFFVDNLRKLNLSDDIIKEIVPEPFLDYYNATHEKGKVIKKYDFYMSGIIKGNQSNNINNPNINIINNNIINKGNINNGERTIVEVKKQGENEKKDMEKDNGFFEMKGIIQGNRSNNNNLGLIDFKNIDINKYAEENNNLNSNIDLVNNRKKETRIIEKGEIDKNIANKNKNVNTINNLKEKNNDIILNSGKMIKNASSKGEENKDNIKNSNNNEIKGNNLDVEAGKLATCNNQ